ncbi:MAG TPA: DUF624 domain-containing protein [Aggregatilineaceae bacterium]|nr:DUF624 domain-containing protein [Aggregatilineaceae bacterium]
MQNALKTFAITARDWWDNMLGIAITNLLWLGLSLTIVGLGPATAGIHGVANSITHGKGQHFEDFVSSTRRYLWISQRWVILNILVGITIYVNLVFYGSGEGLLALGLRTFVVSLTVLWLATQFYVWPFLMEQEDKRLRVAFRNAAFLALASPVYTITMLVLATVVILLSLVTVLPLGVFTVVFLGILGNRAVIERLRVFGKIPAETVQD